MAEPSEVHLLGRNAALKGYSVQAPSHLRSVRDLRDYEDGWLAGIRERKSLLEGKQPVVVSNRTAIPCVRSMADKKWGVRWVDQGSGLEYASPELAKTGLEDRVKREAELGKALAALKPRR